MDPSIVLETESEEISRSDSGSFQASYDDALNRILKKLDQLIVGMDKINEKVDIILDQTNENLSAFQKIKMKVQLIREQLNSNKEKIILASEETDTDGSDSQDSGSDTDTVTDEVEEFQKPEGMDVRCT